MGRKLQRLPYTPLAMTALAGAAVEPHESSLLPGKLQISEDQFTHRLLLAALNATVSIATSLKGVKRIEASHAAFGALSVWGLSAWGLGTLFLK